MVSLHLRSPCYSLSEETHPSLKYNATKKKQSGDWPYLCVLRIM